MQDNISSLKASNANKASHIQSMQQSLRAATAKDEAQAKELEDLRRQVKSLSSINEQQAIAIRGFQSLPDRPPPLNEQTHRVSKQQAPNSPVVDRQKQPSVQQDSKVLMGDIEHSVRDFEKARNQVRQRLAES